MRLLLDTHTFIWFITGNPQLPPKIRHLIADIDHDVFISMASLWEMAIKNSRGKLTFNQPFEKLIPEQLDLNEIQILPITLSDLTNLIYLPFNHRDPFDRLIVAQAISSELPIVTRDSEFVNYPVELIW